MVSSTGMEFALIFAMSVEMQAKSSACPLATLKRERHTTSGQSNSNAALPLTVKRFAERKQNLQMLSIRARNLLVAHRC